MKKSDLLAVVDREIKLRERVYPRWVELGRMSRTKAAEELAGMRAVRAALVDHVPADVEPQGDLFR